MQKETVEIGEEYGSEYKGVYVFQEITWAKRSRIIQKHTKYNPLTGQVVSSDFIAIQAETIWASLKQQPQHKPVSLEKLLSEEDGIPIGLGELFSSIVNRLNSVEQEEARFLSEPYDAKNQTRPLQASACAKSSAGPSHNCEDNQQKPCSNSSSSSTS